MSDAPKRLQPIDIKKLVDFIRVRSTLGESHDKIMGAIEFGLVQAIVAVIAHFPKQVRQPTAAMLCARITHAVLEALRQDAAVKPPEGAVK